MLTEREMEFFSAVISKLQADGQDVRALKEIMARERAKINELMAVDLSNYFPVKGDGVLTRVSDIQYGSKHLRVDMTVLFPRENGVFDRSSAPELFESVLGNSLAECMRRIETEYKEEVAKLKVKVEKDMITADALRPIILTIGTMTLYVEEGEIDKSLSWEVSGWEESKREITLKAGLIIKTLKVSRGDYVAEQDTAKTVIITQSP